MSGESQPAPNKVSAVGARGEPTSSAFPDPITAHPVTDEADELLLSPPTWATRGMVYVLAGIMVIAVLVATVVSIDLTATGTGKLVTESDVATLRSPVSGPVISVSVREGTTVRRGDVLVQIDPQEVLFRRRSLESELVRAEQSLLVAQSERQPEEELAKLIGEVARLRAGLDDASRKEKQTTLRAPIDGVVSELGPRGPGEVLTEGALVARVLPRSAPLIAEVMIPNADIGRVRVGQGARVTIGAYSSMKFGKLRGRVVSVSPDSDRESSAYRVRVTLENVPDERRLQSGMALSADIITQRKPLWAVLLGTDESRG